MLIPLVSGEWKDHNQGARNFHVWWGPASSLLPRCYFVLESLHCRRQRTKEATCMWSLLRATLVTPSSQKGLLSSKGLLCITVALGTKFQHEFKRRPKHADLSIPPGWDLHHRVSCDLLQDMWLGVLQEERQGQASRAFISLPTGAFPDDTWALKNWNTDHFVVEDFELAFVSWSLLPGPYLSRNCPRQTFSSETPMHLARPGSRQQVVSVYSQVVRLRLQHTQ